jgi:hypothetical protein
LTVGSDPGDAEVTSKQHIRRHARAFDPGIHEAAQREQYYGLRPQRVIMDCRVKPGNDAERAERNGLARAKNRGAKPTAK